MLYNSDFENIVGVDHCEDRVYEAEKLIDSYINGDGTLTDIMKYYEKLKKEAKKASDYYNWRFPSDYAVNEYDYNYSESFMDFIVDIDMAVATIKLFFRENIFNNK